MKYGFSQKLFGYFYHSSCMKQAKRQHLQIDSKAIKQEYRAILTRAKDIGKSRLMSSYCMGAYFIALNRNTTLSPEECYALYKKAIASGLTPILCCGETLEQREMGVTMDWIRLQIKSDLAGVAADDVKNLVIAYEPIWAIGTGKTATSDQAEEVCKGIRELIAEVYDTDTAEAVRIQYGGSMNAGNAKELLAKPNIDGGLIGGASLKAEFGQVVNA